MTSRREQGGAASGFTLIELLVVLAIMGLALALFRVGRSPVSASLEARETAREIAQALRAARGEAMMRDRPIYFTLDVTQGLYSWGAEPARRLPSDLRLALLTSEDELGGKGVGSIRFDPDGGASGGRVTIDGAGKAWQVGVDWLSGRVTIAEKAP